MGVAATGANGRWTGASIIGVALSIMIGFPAIAQDRPATDERVDKILKRVEDRQVDDIDSNVKWTVENAMDETSQSHTGRLRYRQSKPVSKFIVEFDRRIEDGRKSRCDERHLFDGRWYVHLQSAGKTVTRREIRSESDTRDPFKLGEGPFPLPFGQTREAIHREFDVTLIPPVKSDPEDSDHLQLRPRGGSQTGEVYTRIDFWIQRGGKLDGLPIRVMAFKKDGTGKTNQIITVSFSEVKLNTGMSESVFKIDTPGGYHEEIVPLDEAADARPKP
jgi:hypothetical protein